MLKSTKILLVTLSMLIIFCMENCYTHWTEKQKQDFAQKCSKTDTIQNLTFALTGFEYNELKKIDIQQIHNGNIVDSFYVYPNRNSFDSIAKKCWANIDRSMYIKDTYQFVISGQKPFVLSDMKMVMWGQNTMTSEGYGCEMGDYKIDGIRFEHNANPNFVKRN